jgi:hypothetical protein
MLTELSVVPSSVKLARRCRASAPPLQPDSEAPPPRRSRATPSRRRDHAVLAARALLRPFLRRPSLPSLSSPQDAVQRSTQKPEDLPVRLSELAVFLVLVHL